MTPEQRRIFVAVAERQHVTRAAEALPLAQSAVSSAIHALEESCGIKLFHRVERPGRAFRSLLHAGRTPSRSAEAVLAGIAQPALGRIAAAQAAGL